MPLPRYHGLISPPAESSSQPFVSSCPKGGLVTAIHVNRVVCVATGPVSVSPNLEAPWAWIGSK